MKRTQLLSEMARVRAELEALVDDLGERHMLEPGAVGDWTVRDVLAHLTAWEVDMLTNLGRVKRGVKPGNVQWNKASIQQQNETWHAEMKDRSLHSVRIDWEGARKQTLRVLEGMSDAEANKPAGWLQGRSVADYVAEMTLNHEREHLEHLREWQRSAGSAPRAGLQSNGARAEMGEADDD